MGESRTGEWDASDTRYLQLGFQAWQVSPGWARPQGEPGTQLCEAESVFSKWHNLLCQQRPVQLHASWEGVPEWSIFLLDLSKEFEYSEGPVCWRLRSVVEDEASP